MEPQQYADHPPEELRRNVYVSPFWEDELLIPNDNAVRVLGGSSAP